MRIKFPGPYRSLSTDLLLLIVEIVVKFDDYTYSLLHVGEFEFSVIYRCLKFNEAVKSKLKRSK